MCRLSEKVIFLFCYLFFLRPYFECIFLSEGGSKTLKNLYAKAITAKNKLESVPMRAKAAVLCTLASISPAYCDINGNSAMQKFLKTMFSIILIVINLKKGLRST